MTGVAPPTLRFDGQDVADALLYSPEVEGYALLVCPHCGTLRAARLPFCCELAADTAARRTPRPAVAAAPSP